MNPEQEFTNLSKRKKELLKHFKSFKKLCDATVEQLSEVVPVSVAHEIVKTLHQ